MLPRHIFYPRSPCGERQALAHILRWLSCISIHALHTESDNEEWNKAVQEADFYPRSPYGERQNSWIPLNSCMTFLSTLSIRRATSSRWRKVKSSQISIHALHTESDRKAEAGFLQGGYFYPRSPYGERLRFRISSVRRNRFLSTLSIRRATRPGGSARWADTNFYPRSPYGERLRQYRRAVFILLFLSTLSIRRATLQTQNMTFSGKISIHALHTESDLNASIIQAGILKSHFYPRSPYGERPNAVPTERTVNRISIHALHTESDERSHLSSARLFAISIHALHTESDQTEEYKNIALLDFYPRSPYGERPWQENNDDIVDAFLSTLSIRRATRRKNIRISPCWISIHALHTESDPGRKITTIS